MIPQPVYDFIKSARFENHGAVLTRGSKAYHLQLDLHHDGNHVVATEFVTLTGNDQLPAWKAKGYSVSRGTTDEERRLYPHWPMREPLAWRDIAPSSVPESDAAEWETWDEY
jgi:hypothetical protein